MLGRQCRGVRRSASYVRVLRDLAGLLTVTSTTACGYSRVVLPKVAGVGSPNKANGAQAVGSGYRRRTACWAARSAVVRECPRGNAR